MDLIADIVSRGPDPLLQFALVSHKSLPDVVRQGGRGAIRHVISFTPPATAAGIQGGLDSGSEAKQRGFRTIERDLNKVFSPVRIKGKRRGGMTGAELVGVHLRHLAAKRPGSPMRRDRPQPYFVDRRLFQQLLVKLRSHVGRLAAGWMPAAAALSVATPAWISRHGLSRGTYQADFGGDVMFIRSVNHASAHAPTAELQRRVPYAVTYALNDMRRQIPYILRKQAAQLSFGVGFAPTAVSDPAFTA
jgi:hypothetical protein